VSADQADLYRQIIESLDEGIYFVDRGRRITFWNAGAERLTGFASAEVVDQACCDGVLRHIGDAGTGMCGGGACPLGRTIASGQGCASEAYLRHKAGHRVPVRLRVIPIRDRSGAVIGAVQIFADNSPAVADRRRIAELEQAAALDPLTGLGNRRSGDHELRHRLDELTRYGWRFGVVFVDVDSFKQVNDRWGHEVGDQVLRMVGRDLQVGVRESDRVFRWGGEEFLVAVLNVDEDSLVRIAEKLRYLVEQSGFDRGGEPVRVTVSAGATMARPGETAQALVERADRLMYQSKRAGRNRVSTRLPSDQG